MPDILVQPMGDRYLVTLPDVVMEFAHVRDHSDGLAAELMVYRVATGERHWARFSLSSTQARAGQVKAVERTGPCPGFAGFLDEACYQITQLARTVGVAVPILAASARNEGITWLVPGLIPIGDTSVLYGDGGSGKSLLALALAMSGLTGAPLAKSERWRVAPLRSVLYLDWESEVEAHHERLRQLQSDHGTGAVVTGLRHLHMARPLSDMVASVCAELAREPTDLVIVDSLAFAGGGEPESAEAAIRTLAAVRQLGQATKLVIAHVSKQSMAATGPARPYGSVFVYNGPRSTILATGAEAGEPGNKTLTVTYNHEKMNDGPKSPPRALTFCFGDRAINVISGEPDLSKAPVAYQIRQALKTGKASVATIAEKVTSTTDTIRKELSRLEKHGTVLKLVEGGKGKGDETIWGLVR